ncbi:hypothetical protein [Streptomyces vilmorinianum]|uniref:hypothetical protein n=1 Tax=Streptomyces vilmorinianum TaxID=3051092 RepID=UPI0010FB94BA|nr:hypothetical protein [Streptomyces vilmorinianum]
MFRLRADRLGFHRLRAPFAAAAHGVACALLVVLTLVMTGAAYTATYPEENPLPPQPIHQCRSSDDNSECPGG